MGAGDMMGHQSMPGMGLSAMTSSASYSSPVPSMHPSMHSLIPTHHMGVHPSSHHSSPHHHSSSPPIGHGEHHSGMDLHT